MRLLIIIPCRVGNLRVTVLPYCRLLMIAIKRVIMMEKNNDDNASGRGITVMMIMVMILLYIVDC